MRKFSVGAMVAATMFMAAAPVTDAIAAGQAATTKAPPKQSFAGKVSGTNAYIALVSDGKRVSGYVSDSTSASEWLKPAPASDASRVTLRTRAGRVLGTARLDAAVATGTIQFRGRVHSFRAVRTTGSVTGLHRGAVRKADTGYEAGWIVLADGTQRGEVSRFDAETRTRIGSERAPKLDPSRTNEVPIPDGTPVPPVVVTELVVIAIIAILIGPAIGWS